VAKVAARGRGRRTINEINMVPFIDVMLVLLIIFMVTAPLITPSQIALPSVGQAGRQPDQFVQVVIDKDENLQVRDGGSSKDSAGSVVGATANSVPVVISADKGVRYEAVVKVMDKLQRAGVSRVGLSVQTSR
jgi:biopolymer transport protein TolR